MKHYVVCHYYEYEGYSEPMAVYTSLRKLRQDYPNAVADAASKQVEGVVYFTFDRGNHNQFESIA